MTELLTAAQMRAIETAAIESGQVTGAALMERAGQGVVEAILQTWPELGAPLPAAGGQPPDPRGISGQKKGDPHAVVLCGPGNNGGDGFVIARLLATQGWQVGVFHLGDPDALPPDARFHHDRWCEAGEIRPFNELSAELWRVGPLVIDAIFGTGLSRPVPDAVGDVLRSTKGCRRVAVDVPSLLASDTGRKMAEGDIDCGGYDLTVTFHSAKPGHVLADGPGICGKIKVVDIGLGGTFDAPNRRALAQCEGLDLGHAESGTGDPLAPRVLTALAACPVPPKRLLKGGGHKFQHGHALILSGGVGKGGAARLAARGALRIGAGLVTVGCPPAALIENAAALDAVMVRKIDDLDAVLSDDRINALCLGPGLGTGPREAGLVRQALNSGRPLCLDADALTLIAEDPALFAQVHDQCVLTPHGGEFARLFPDLAEALSAPVTQAPGVSKVDATRAAARRTGCTVLFKGPETVIAASDGRCAVNAAVYDRAAPWLATAGSGDVLSGFIAGLLARGFAPPKAAETAAWLHTECALSFGPGLIAEDLPEALPQVLARVARAEDGAPPQGATRP